MNTGQLNTQFSSEVVCRQFFEAAWRPNGRICPHCSFSVSYMIQVGGPNQDRYECKRCKRQFTVTTKIAMHSTKLPLRKWLQAMYLILSSSKGISYVVPGPHDWRATATAWRVGHAIRLMIGPERSNVGILQGLVELDDKYIPTHWLKEKRKPGQRNLCLIFEVSEQRPIPYVRITTPE